MAGWGRYCIAKLEGLNTCTCLRVSLVPPSNTVPILILSWFFYCIRDGLWSYIVCCRYVGKSLELSS